MAGSYGQPAKQREAQLGETPGSRTRRKGGRLGGAQGGISVQSLWGRTHCHLGTHSRAWVPWARQVGTASQVQLRGDCMSERSLQEVLPAQPSCLESSSHPQMFLRVRPAIRLFSICYLVDPCEQAAATALFPSGLLSVPSPIGLPDSGEPPSSAPHRGTQGALVHLCSAACSPEDEAVLESTVS